MNSKLKILVSVMAMSFIMVGCGETPANISGEAFLKTQGGSVITCAGSPVYIEKADKNGYIYLIDTMNVKKDYAYRLIGINYVENRKRKYRVRKLENTLENSSLDRSINSIKQQLGRAEALKAKFERKGEKPEFSNSISVNFIKQQLKQAKKENNFTKVDYWKGRLKRSSPSYIRKQLKQAKKENNSKNVDYWKTQLKHSSPNFIRKQQEEEIKKHEQVKKENEEKIKKHLEEISKVEKEKEEEIKKHLEEIKKVKEENEKKSKKESEEILVAKKEISKLEERLKNVTKEDTKETTCNGQGNFSFSELQPGNYYISTTVQWKVGDEIQGGNVNKVITLKEGDNKVIISE